MEYAEQISRPFPWRVATLVAVAVATLELVALIVIGALLLAKPLHHKPRVASTPVRHSRAVTRVRRFASLPVHPLLSRSRVSVLVLNGNGVSGAAAREAAKLQGLGYRIGGSTNAQRHDYARSMVMYVPPFVREARRLARDTGISLVAPVDGMRPSQLHGSQIVIVLGT